MAKDGYLAKFLGISEEEAKALKERAAKEDDEKILSEEDFLPPEDSTLEATDEDGRTIRAALFYNHKRLVTDAEANAAVRLWDVDPEKFAYCKYVTKKGKIIPGTQLPGVLGEWTPKKKK